MHHIQQTPIWCWLLTFDRRRIKDMRDVEPLLLITSVEDVGFALRVGELELLVEAFHAPRAGTCAPGGEESEFGQRKEVLRGNQK